MLLSICIPTYNRPKHLLNCLNSLTLQSYKNFEVCISDNASDSNIKKIIKPFLWPMVNLYGFWVMMICW